MSMRLRFTSDGSGPFKLPWFSDKMHLWMETSEALGVTEVYCDQNAYEKLDKIRNLILSNEYPVHCR